MFISTLLNVLGFQKSFIDLSLSLNNLIIMSRLNRIKLVLVEQEKTGGWLAEELGKSVCTVSKWCSNSAQPDLKTLDQIARVLRVNVKDLLNDTSNV